MQISDLVNQYNSNMATGGEISTKSKGVEQLVSTVRKLTAGQVFEGTVNSIKGNQVILGLSSGQNITATLSRDISLVKGQSVFFQVKSNDGQTIQIKPVSNSAMNNPTLLNALDSANLSVNERNVNMVNNMMREQLPIDSASLNNMSRIVTANPDINVATIIQMNKLGIEVSPEMAAQYENYKANEASVMNTIMDLSNAIPEMLSSDEITTKQAVELNKEIVNILTNQTDAKPALDPNVLVDKVANAAVDSNGNVILSEIENVVGNDLATGKEAQVQTLSAENLVANEVGNDIKNISNNSQTIELDAFVNQVNNENESNISQTNMTTQAEQISQTNGTAQDAEISMNTEAVFKYSYDQEAFPRNTIGNTLTSDKLETLNNIIKNDNTFIQENQKFFDENGNIKLDVNVNEFMKSLSEHLSEKNSSLSRNIFSNDGYKDLVNNLTQQQWMLETTDVEDADKVKQLYERLNKNMNQLQEAVKDIAKIENQVTKAVDEIKSNIEFMNQVNQNFAYVQLPIRMSRQNANSELYVYKNKRIKSDDEEISAFLHFDMDHLGSTDISVKLLNKKVDTKFYMEDESSYELIMNNVEILQKKLENKGYNCNISVENDAKNVNLVEDFLKHDSKGNTSPLSRYSFDVRA